jgi:pimeloyl-[acyl-carrier protein] methyl ester esterase
MSTAPLVLLPGLDGTGRLFQPFLSALPSEVQTTVISYPRDRVLSLAEHAEWVADRLPSKKSVLLAESFSGLVALTLLTGAAASRIQCVIFVGSFAEPPRPYILKLAPILPWTGSLMGSIPSFLFRQYCLGREATVGQVNLLRDAISSVSPEVLFHRLSMVARRHSFGQGQFKMPAHYIQASNDRLVPERCVNWFRQRFDSPHLTKVDGPHFLLQMRPEQCAEVVAQVLLLQSSR